MLGRLLLEGALMKEFSSEDMSSRSFDNSFSNSHYDTPDHEVIEHPLQESNNSNHGDEQFLDDIQELHEESFFSRLPSFVQDWISSENPMSYANPLLSISAIRFGSNLKKSDPHHLGRLLRGESVKLSELFPDRMDLDRAEHDVGRMLSLMHVQEYRWGGIRFDIAVGSFSSFSDIPSDQSVDEEGADFSNEEDKSKLTTTDLLNSQEPFIPIFLYPTALEEDPQGDISQTKLRVYSRPIINPHLKYWQKEHDINIEDFRFLREYIKNPFTSLEDTQQFLVDGVKEVIRNRPQFSLKLKIEPTCLLGTFFDPTFTIAWTARRVAQILSKERSRSNLLSRAATNPKLTDIHELKVKTPPDSDLYEEFGIGDVSESIRQCGRQAIQGHSIIADIPSNRSSVHAGFALATGCAAQGRSVLYVPTTAHEKEDFLQLVEENDLQDFVLDLTDPHGAQALDRTIINTLTHQSDEVDPIRQYNTIADELVGMSSRLNSYFSQLHTPIEPWDVSLYEILEHLAAIAALPSHPSNRVRFNRETARKIKGNLHQWKQKLVAAGHLGMYEQANSESPWYKAAIYTEAEAKDAEKRVVRLLDKTLPSVRFHIEEAARSSGFGVPETISEWGRQITNLQNFRRVLDAFQPQVFEYNLQPLIEATLPKSERDRGSSMGRWERKRRVKEAKSLLRPGIRVPDLHEALKEVDRQAREYHRLVPAGTWPVLPDNLDGAVEVFDSLTADTTALDMILAPTKLSSPLTEARFVDLEDYLHRLYENKDDLALLPYRNEFDREVEEVGLSELVQDFRQRKVPAQNAGDELSLTWWTTIFDMAMAEFPLILQEDSEALGRTIQSFIKLDERHIESIAPLVKHLLRKKLNEILYSNEDRANQLHHQLNESLPPSMSDVARAYPEIFHAAAPIIIGSPAVVATQFGVDMTSQVVIIDGATHAPSEHIFTVLNSAPTSILLADTKFLSPGLTKYAAHLLPHVHQERYALAIDTRLREFLMQCDVEEYGYPASGSIHTSLEFQWVDSRIRKGGKPSREELASSHVEVDEVVSRIAYHARHADKYRQSLTVIAFNALHAARLREALRQARNNGSDIYKYYPHLEVLTLEEAAAITPGDIILTTGYGKGDDEPISSPQWSLLQRPNSSALLLNILANAAGSCEIISGLTHNDLEPVAREYSGVRLLQSLMEFCTDVNSEEDQKNAPSGIQPSELDPSQIEASSSELLGDLAVRICMKGYSADVDYHYPDGNIIPLVAGSRPRNYRVAVLMDTPQLVKMTSLRTRYRVIPQALESNGWVPHNVGSVGLFIDPQTEVQRLAHAIDATES